MQLFAHRMVRNKSAWSNL